MINDEYEYTEYEDEKMIVMNSTGFLNASQFCSQRGKDVQNWLARKETQREIEETIEAHKKLEYLKAQIPNDELIDYLAQLRNRVITLTMTVEPGDTPTSQEVAGIYIHRDLMPHLNEWLFFDREGDYTILRHINDEYKYIKYNGKIEAIFMKSNGYLNASKLCSDNERNVQDWLAKEGTQKCIDFITIQKSKELMITVEDIPEVSGIYLHRYLFNLVCAWVLEDYQSTILMYL